MLSGALKRVNYSRCQARWDCVRDVMAKIQVSLRFIEGHGTDGAVVSELADEARVDARDRVLEDVGMGAHMGYFLWAASLAEDPVLALPPLAQMRQPHEAVARPPAVLLLAPSLAIQGVEAFTQRLETPRVRRERLHPVPVADQ